MTIFTVRTDFGGAITAAVKDWKRETGEDQTDLLKRVGDVLDVSVNTLRKYLSYPDPPTKTLEKVQITALLFVIGRDPADYGLSLDDMPPGLLRRLSGCITAVRRAA